jgi:ubiquinone biosynthesis protein
MLATRQQMHPEHEAVGHGRLTPPSPTRRIAPRCEQRAQTRGASSGRGHRTGSEEWRAEAIASMARVSEVGAAFGTTLAHIAIDGGRSRLGRRRTTGETGPTRLRAMLEELGPTFTKLGQLMAGRPELLPSAYRSELTLLRDATAPLPGVVILHALSRAYAQPLDTIFASVSLEPVASGSIGQVHRATLRDGRSVALKIRRPDAARMIEADLAALGSVARAADRFLPPLRRFGLTDVVAEFDVALRAELDYELEATNTVAIAERLQQLDWVRVPAVVTSLCRPGVLVMEFAEGIPLTDTEALDRAGIDRVRLASRVVAANLQMVLFSDVFHADPHAGNYLAAPDGRLVLLDFGQIGHSTPETRADLLRLVTALASGDADQVAQAVGSMCQASPDVMDELTDDVAGFVATFAELPLGEFRVGSVLRDLLALLGRHHLALPVGMTMLIKAVMECEATAEELHTDIRLSELLLVAGALGAPAVDQAEPARP